MGEVDEDPSQEQTPQDHALRPGRGGVIPPVEHRWKPGQSANPGGRPKGSYSIKEALRRDLRRNAVVDPDEGEDAAPIGAVARELSIKAQEAARAGDTDGVRAVLMIVECVEGKPTEYVETKQQIDVAQRVVFVEAPLPAEDIPQMPE